MNAIEKLKSSPLDYLGERVITLGMMDEAHGRPAGTAGRTFRKHREQLREGEDYFRTVLGSDVSRRTSGRGDDVLLTESGYLLLVKAFRDPLAWTVQRDLVTGYFRGRALAQGLDPVVAMLVEQVSQVHAVLYNFVQGTLSAHDRRIDGIERAASDRFAQLERTVKQLRRGSRVSAMGRASGRDRRVKPREPTPLALALPGSHL